MLHIIRQLGLAAGLFLAMPAYAQGCWPDAPSWVSIDREPYTGYQSTGYKGSMERDNAWFRVVKSIKQADGKDLYKFKWQGAKDKILYDSIEPILLGGRTSGFAAYRENCGELLDARGKKFDLPLFSSIGQDRIPEGQTANVVRLKLDGLTSGGWRYALFKNGNLQAFSRSDYLNSYYDNSMGGKFPLSSSYRGVSTKMSGGWGVVKLDTLDEVIEPRWQGVGSVSVSKTDKWTDTQATYLLAKDERSLHLFSINGTPIKIPLFDHIKVEYNWVPPYTAGLERDFETVIITTDEASGTCRLYSAKMNPIFNVNISIDRATRKCPRPTVAVSLAFTNSLGRTQIYDITVNGGMALRVEKDDEIFYQFRTGVIVFRRKSQEGMTFWVASPDGTRLNDTNFTEFTHLGCDFVRVKRDGVWVMLLPDGTIDKRLSVPVSC